MIKVDATASQTLRRKLLAPILIIRNKEISDNTAVRLNFVNFHG